MTRQIDKKAVLTVAVLLGLFLVALLRTNHWKLPTAWGGWRAIAARKPPPSPEDGVYAMFDAARAGDAQAYLDCFSGPLRDQLAATAREDAAAKFKAYLINQNSSVQGMAVTVTDRPNADEARARLEYVYGDHNEVQDLRLKREGARWKIIDMSAAQPVQPLVPYGTKATE
jgi:hypothetical protein